MSDYDLPKRRPRRSPRGTSSPARPGRARRPLDAARLRCLRLEGPDPASGLQRPSEGGRRANPATIPGRACPHRRGVSPRSQRGGARHLRRARRAVARRLRAGSTSCRTRACRSPIRARTSGIGRSARRTRRTAGAGSARSRGAAEGPLAGRTVGVKDNVCVAGVPMLNGSPIMEGYVPREDATVVTRLLDAGAHIVGKTAVPAFCFDGGGLTGYPDPQPTNPHDPAYLVRRVVQRQRRGRSSPARRTWRSAATRAARSGCPSSWSGCCGHKPTLRARALHRDLPDRADARPHRPDGDDGGRLRAHARGDRRRGRARPAPDRRRRPSPTRRRSRSARTGCASACCREGFEIPDASEADVDAAVRGAADALAGAGAEVEEVSVPMHRDGLAIWNAIAIEGATDLMVRGDALRHQPQGPLHDRPRRLLRPRAPRPRPRLLGHRQAHGAARRLSVGALQPPLLRQGAEPRAAAARPLRRGAGALRRARCCPRRR